MITLFGQQVYSAKGESFGFENGQAKDCSQDATDFEVTPSCGSAVMDLNQTPVNKPASNHQQCFFQDLNFPSIEESILVDVHEKDSNASLASRCTAVNNSRTEKEDSCEAFQMATESLFHLSSVLFKQSQEFPSQDKTKKCIEEPSRSSDSFELHTLEIIETIPEDVSSKSVDEFSNNNELGVKVKRGRRMKNFQKDVLPGLVSLSRQEIREDINILEAVSRSKEDKKMQGKTKDGKCIPNPRNNKYSTQRYVGSKRRRIE